MPFTPMSRVYLIDCPLDNTYKNTLHFDDIGDQHTYFYNHIVHTFDDLTYVRKDNVIRVREHIDNLWNCNYVAYQNANFNNKWFYAFITKMEYINDDRTDIHIETDVFQTWLFDVQILPSFVVREHVNDDTIGKHLVDEQLDFGEYKMPVYEASGELGANWNILAVSDNSPLGNTDPIGNLYGGLVTGFTYFPFPNTAAGITWLKNTIAAYVDAGKADAIVMIFTVPEIAVPSIMNNGGTWTLGQPITTQEPYGFHTLTKAKRLATIDGYTPRNNKMHVYPYKFLYASNNNGMSANYRYEDFVNADMGFMITSALMPNPTVMLSPTDYKGATLSYEHSLTLQGFPMCSWNTDMYAAWLAQNGLSNGIALIGSTAAVVAGLVTANPLAVGGGAMGVAHQLAQFYQASIQPDQAKGHVGGGSLMYSVHALDFYFVHMEIKAEYAKRIDDFFTMYGYKVNTLKVPETRSRLNWNYVQTIDINIRGAIPDNDMNRLKQAYNEGITLWHSSVNFLDYSQPNTIINENILAPTLQTAESNDTGTLITLTFDKAMANPVGKHGQFVVNVNGEIRAASLIALTETNKYGLALSTPIMQQQVVTVSYTQGNIVSADGGLLANFTATVTNNVPVSPQLLSAATNTAGTVITLNFDKNMNDPAGKESQFNVIVNGNARSIIAVNLNIIPTKIDITLSSAATPGQIIQISYTKGDVTATNTAPLESFTNISVINNNVTIYQKWANYPDSPSGAELAAYPYQTIIYNPLSASTILIVSATKQFINGGNYSWVSGGSKMYTLMHSTYYYWRLDATRTTPTNYQMGGNGRQFLEANNDVYTDSSLSTVAFSKNTV